MKYICLGYMEESRFESMTERETHAAPKESKPAHPLQFFSRGSEKSDLVEFSVPGKSALVGKQIVDLGIPRGALIVLIGRGEDFVVPSGGTLIEPSDRLLILGDREALALVSAMLKKSLADKDR
jgi:cell volume regulation protein A